MRWLPRSVAVVMVLVLKGTAEAKLTALRAAGVSIAETPSDLGSTMARVIGHHAAT